MPGAHLPVARSASPGIVSFDGGVSKQDLKMAWNTGKACTACFDHPLKHDFRIHEPVLDYDLTSHPEVRMKERSSVAVMEGENSHDAVPLRERHVRNDGFSIGDDIAVRHHHAARLPSRSGGEYQCRQIIRPRPVHIGSWAWCPSRSQKALLR